MSETPPSASSPLLVSFDYRPVTRLVFGAGVVSRLGEVAKELGGRRALVVTDRGILAAGHVDRGLQSLSAADVASHVFDGVHENPTTSDVAACVDAAVRFGCDMLIGFGGGSSMDCAKGANFLLTNGGKMSDYWGVGKATKPMLPMIAVPTTAGTGSEAQSFALIADERTHQKMACGDPKAACRAAILDPEVTVSQPPRVTAVVGMDAVAHAVESFVSNRRNAISIGYAANAWRMLSANFPRVLESPLDLEARGGMLLGANLAGSAIESSMLGAAHAAANPLTATFNVTHGVAVGVMLPWVVRYNARVCGSWYAELTGDGDAEAAGERLSLRLTKMLKQAELPTTLAECGVEEDSLPKLAEEAAAQWTAGFNPRPIAAAEFEGLYRAAFRAG